MPPIGHTILRYDEVTSTNTLLLANESLLAMHGLVMVARHQTAGRGRMGRVWASVPGAQLQFSVVVHPHVPEAEVPLVALLAGLAVANGVADATGVKLTLRWPNDVFLNGRKLCGILVEAKPDAEGKARLVVGIGINCQGRAEDFPREVRGVLTTLAQAAPQPVDSERVLQAVLAAFDRVITRLASGERQALLEEWQALAPLRGARVRLPTPHGPIAAIIEGFTPDGFLSARDEQGQQRTVVSSDMEWL